MNATAKPKTPHYETVLRFLHKKGNGFKITGDALAGHYPDRASGTTHSILSRLVNAKMAVRLGGRPLEYQLTTSGLSIEQMLRRYQKAVSGERESRAEKPAASPADGMLITVAYHATDGEDNETLTMTIAQAREVYGQLHAVFTGAL